MALNWTAWEIFSKSQVYEISVGNTEGDVKITADINVLVSIIPLLTAENSEFMKSKALAKRFNNIICALGEMISRVILD